jgi:hypothetical protein
MAGGQLVVVRTFDSGGNRLCGPVVVAEPDPIKAEKLASKVLRVSGTTMAVCSLTADQMMKFDLRPGECTNPWWT